MKISQKFSTKNSCLLLLVAISLFEIGCQKCTNTNDACPPCYSSFTDPRDGEVYQTVILCGQEWMAENLRYDIPNLWSDSITRDSAVIDTFDVLNSDSRYGRYYDGYRALIVCPDGWHLPSNEEWETLEVNLGLDLSGNSSYRPETIGEGLKAAEGWRNNGGGDNSTGLNILPTGYFSFEEPFSNPYAEAYFWTSTTCPPLNGEDGVAYVRRLFASNNRINNPGMNKKYGLACRCLKD